MSKILVATLCSVPIFSFLWIVLQIIGQRIGEYKSVTGVRRQWVSHFWEMCPRTSRHTVFLSKTNLGDLRSICRKVAHVLKSQTESAGHEKSGGGTRPARCAGRALPASGCSSVTAAKRFQVAADDPAIGWSRVRCVSSSRSPRSPSCSVSCRSPLVAARSNPQGLSASAGDVLAHTHTRPPCSVPSPRPQSAPRRPERVPDHDQASPCPCVGGARLAPPRRVARRPRVRTGPEGEGHLSSPPRRGGSVEGQRPSLELFLGIPTAISGISLLRKK